VATNVPRHTCLSLQQRLPALSRAQRNWNIVGKFFLILLQCVAYVSGVRVSKFLGIVAVWTNKWQLVLTMDKTCTWEKHSGNAQNRDRGHTFLKFYTSLSGLQSLMQHTVTTYNTFFRLQPVLHPQQSTNNRHTLSLSKRDVRFDWLDDTWWDLPSSISKYYNHSFLFGSYVVFTGNIEHNVSMLGYLFWVSSHGSNIQQLSRVCAIVWRCLTERRDNIHLWPGSWNQPLIALVEVFYPM
jgi:hypothetical protein